MGKCDCGRLKGNPCGLLRPNTINVTMPNLDPARCAQSVPAADREKAALAYAYALTRSDPEFQKRHAGAREHFTEVEIAEIAAIVINMNVWTRLKLAQGATPQYK